jgi:hypothetical protein
VHTAWSCFWPACRERVCSPTEPFLGMTGRVEVTHVEVMCEVVAGLMLS